MEKEYEYQVNENRKIILSIIHDGFLIKDAIFINNLYKDYTIMFTDDYGLSAYTENENALELEFLIDKENPLYLPFVHFLKNDEELKIVSDFRESEYDDLAYVKIMKQNDDIKICFVNHNPNEKWTLEKFRFDIKNILWDLRSKIDEEGKDTKDRLHRFFEEAVEIMRQKGILVEPKIKKRN